jgi:hypothetical protein
MSIGWTETRSACPISTLLPEAGPDTVHCVPVGAAALGGALVGDDATVVSGDAPADTAAVVDVAAPLAHAVSTSANAMAAA